MIYKNLKNIFFYLWNAKKIWRKPKQAKILIYDRHGSDYILQYFNASDVEILNVRGETINCYVLFASFISGKIGKVEYRRKYLEYVKPIIAITFIDNSPGFYKLKSIVPELITIFLQNGTRGELGDIFYSLEPSEEYKVDYMLVFGNAIGRKYKHYISGDFLAIGSFKNNLILRKENSAKKKEILFLSQYIEPPQDKSLPFWMELDGKAVFWDQFYEPEVLVLKFLRKYSLSRKLKIKICGRLDTPNNSEYKYYESLLSGSDWEFIPNENLYSSYSIVDASDRIVFIDSTLGYEAFGRGNKIASLSIRAVSLFNDATKFGWPGSFPDNGPFWTNHADEKEFERVMDYLITVDDEQWDKMRTKYKKEIMEYDPGNTLFINLMKKLNVPLKEGI